MCGRFALFASGEELAERYPFVELPPIEPRYNIAPRQPVAVVRETIKGRGLALLKWGFTVWDKVLINARVETAAQKPSFRSAFKHRRCLIPASGYYEWQQTGSRKQPHFIRPKGGGLFAFAGLWEGETCTILTTSANEMMAPLHERMPVIIDRDAESDWLERAVFSPYPSDRMGAYPVGVWVNNARNEGPRCAEPA
jgi:putative SOS response-associated peptidase YedK